MFKIFLLRASLSALPFNTFIELPTSCCMSMLNVKRKLTEDVHSNVNTDVFCMPSDCKREVL